MASTPKGPQKAKIEYYIDKQTYDQFVRICSQHTYAPQIVVERLMKKFIETGQM